MAKIIKIIFILALGLMPFFTNAASLSFSSSVSSTAVGNTFPVSILVTSSSQTMNAASGVISFPWDKLEVISISKQGSIFSLWAEEPSFSNSIGTVNFEGIILNPGFKGTNGKILTIVFKTKREGQANISFSSASVLANDGSGTNILSDLRVAVIDIGASMVPAPEPVSGEGAPDIISSTHPDSTLWYKDKNPEFSWVLPKGSSSVRTAISKSVNTLPTVVYDPPISQKKIENLSDGTYYFTLQIKTKNGWGKIGRYKVNIDTTPPIPFSVAFPHGSSGLEPQPVILFNTEDRGSGISHYNIKINDRGLDKIAPQADSNPYPLPSQKPGEYTVKVSAVDRAGNTTDSSEKFTIEAIRAPTITYYPEEIEAGDLIRIRGITYENSDVTIYVRDENGEVLSKEYIKSNSAGDFNALITKRLSFGTYTFTTYVTDLRGASSYETEPIEIYISSSFFEDVTEIFLDYFGRVVTILLVVLGFAVGIMYFYSKTIKKMKYVYRKEKEIEKMTGKSFDLLRKDIKEHIERLRKVQAKRKLTEEEILFLEEFEKSMAEAEDVITKEIQEISSPEK